MCGRTRPTGPKWVKRSVPGDQDRIRSTLADQASTTLTALNRMLDTNLVIELRGAVRASEQLMRYYADRREGPTAELNATMRQLQAVSARLDTAVAS